MSEGFPKTATKTPEQQLIQLRELQHSLAEARETQDAPAAEALMKDNWDLVFSRETEGLSFEEVEHLLGKDFFGPKAVEKIFGVKPETVPDIPFSKEELERAKELGQQLIFYTDFMAGKAGSIGPVTLENMRTIFTKSHDGEKVFASHGSDDFWYKNEDFFKKEKPRTGWRLTSKDLIPDSTSKNYIEQTDVLVGHLQNTVFKGMELPRQYADAIAEFNRKRAEIKPLAESSTDAEWKKGSQMLAGLAITRLVRELPVEVMYRLVLNDQQNKDKQLPSTYTWTAGRTSGGPLVRVGDFAAKGTDVYRAGPGDSGGRLGVSFSRS
ncbi:MAG: hypothetical protein B7X04_00100 [Parcubacteria group bacterium 21-54-25]|nr:MAG: hypothetical protein B7X04_00100 [Parcubacteria group bacterium 21-54-25]HQU07540.1 hypothetical protein [Candidatus Paceibacterota bacterium]